MRDSNYSDWIYIVKSVRQLFRFLVLQNNCFAIYFDLLFCHVCKPFLMFQFLFNLS